MCEPVNSLINIYNMDFVSFKTQLLIAFDNGIYAIISLSFRFDKVMVYNVFDLKVDVSGYIVV